MTLSDEQLRGVVVQFRLMHSLVTDLIYVHDAAGNQAVLDDLSTVLPAPTMAAVFEAFRAKSMWFEVRPSVSVPQSADVTVFWRSESGEHWLGSCDVARMGWDPQLEWLAAETAWNLAVYDAFDLPRPDYPDSSE